MTTPQHRDANNDDDEIQETKQCFICDASVKIDLNAEKQDHVNLYNTNTSHSDIPIYDLVWKFLGEKPSHRNLTATEADSQWNCVCLNCFQNIEDYDFATSESRKYEKILMEKLSTTEKAYEERNNVEEHVENIEADTDAEMAETDDDIEIIEADEIVELIISDDECDGIEENSQPPQTLVQSPQNVAQTSQAGLQSPQSTQKEEEADEIIELDSDDGERETGSSDGVEFLEQHNADSLTVPEERVLTFNEL